MDRCKPLCHFSSKGGTILRTFTNSALEEVDTWTVSMAGEDMMMMFVDEDSSVSQRPNCDGWVELFGLIYIYTARERRDSRRGRVMSPPTAAGSRAARTRCE